MEQPQKSQNHKLFLFPNSTPSKPLNSISISMTILLIISLPIFYISLLHIPPSNLLKDTAFWFLLSNSIIIIIVATDSDAFSSNHNTDTDRDLHDEFMLHDRARKQSLMAIVPMEKPLALPREEEEKAEERRKEVIVEGDVKKEEVVCLEEKEPLEDSVKSELKETGEEGCDYWSMSDEELNRRVEEFIRFNRKIMLQEARK